MATDEKLVAALIGVVVALVAVAVFVLIRFLWVNEQRLGDLQRQCIAEGGNWRYGCQMKPEAGR